MCIWFFCSGIIRIIIIVMKIGRFDRVIIIIFVAIQRVFSYLFFFSSLFGDIFFFFSLISLNVININYKSLSKIGMKKQLSVIKIYNSQTSTNCIVLVFLCAVFLLLSYHLLCLSIHHLFFFSIRLTIPTAYINPMLKLHLHIHWIDSGRISH